MCGKTDFQGIKARLQATSPTLSAKLPQPLPYGRIVEPEAEPGKTDAAGNGGKSHWPCLGESVEFALDKPHIESIHQRIMHDIQRERDVTRSGKCA